MAKETATPAPAETKAEKKPEKKAPAESVYTVASLQATQEAYSAQCRNVL